MLLILKVHNQSTQYLNILVVLSTHKVQVKLFLNLSSLSVENNNLPDYPLEKHCVAGTQ